MHSAMPFCEVETLEVKMGGKMLYVVNFLAVLGTGLVAGVFLAFSSFVMAALARLPSGNGISAMQAINITVINPLFMAVLFGTAVLCIAVVYSAVRGGLNAQGIIMITGAALYLFGCIAVTMAFNVPLNDLLAGLDPNSAEASNQWSDYLKNWTFWNHVRCLASLAASATFVRALTIVS
jgi:uncharacterized membrane protein